MLILAALAGGSTLPLLAKIKSDLEIGWKIYQKVQIGICIGYLGLTITLILLAFNKEKFVSVN